MDTYLGVAHSFLLKVPPVFFAIVITLFFQNHETKFGSDPSSNSSNNLWINGLLCLNTRAVQFSTLFAS
jgi:hypothetical protein